MKIMMGKLRNIIIKYSEMTKSKDNSLDLSSHNRKVWFGVRLFFFPVAA